MKKGKFIVIDGTDGSGKATQTELILQRFTKEGYKVKKIDFPRYDDNFFGKLIGECLTGKYGNFAEVNPHIASVLYAADRWESSTTIKQWLANGDIVIADRYVSSNQIHQGGKIRNSKKRKEFLEWLDIMEHKVFDIPRPNLLLYLHLPIAITLKLLKEKTLKGKKKYLEGKKDIVENDLKYLENSRKSAIKLVKEHNNCKQIECSYKGEIMSREEINDLIYKEIKYLLK